MYFSYHYDSEKEGHVRRIISFDTIKDISVSNDGSSMVDRDGEWHVFNKEETDIIVKKLEEQGLIVELGKPKHTSSNFGWDIK
jgi:hypothetical protein